MGFSTSTLVATVVSSTLVGLVLIGILGLLIYQAVSKRRMRSVVVRDLAEFNQTPVVEVRRRNTLQKGFRRELPMIRPKTFLGQEMHSHGSWVVPLTAVTTTPYRSRDDLGNFLGSKDARPSAAGSRRASFDSVIGRDSGTIVVRQSIDLNSDATPSFPSSRTLQREQNIFDPDYVPVNRRSRQMDSEIKRDQQKSLFSQARGRRIVSHPSSDARKSSEPRTSSLTTPRRRGHPSWPQNVPRRSRSMDGPRVQYDESKVLVRHNRDSAIDITSPPASSRSAVTSHNTNSADAQFLEYAASGQWLSGLIPFGDNHRPGTVSTRIDFEGPSSPHAGIRSPHQMLRPHLRAGDPYDITFNIGPRPALSEQTIPSALSAPPPSRSSSGSSKGSLSSPPTNPSVIFRPSFEYNKRFMHSALSITTQGRALSPLNEFSEPSSSIASRSDYSGSINRSASNRSGSTIRGPAYDDDDVSPRTLTAPPLPLIRYTSPPSPTFSTRSIDSEAFSDRTVSNLHGLTPRPRTVEESFRPIAEEPSSHETSESGSGSATPRAIWSPSLLSLSAPVFPASPRYPPPPAPSIKAPEMATIQDVFGPSYPFRTPRESMAVHELERAIQEIGQRLNWVGQEEKGEPISPKDGPRLDKGKGKATLGYDLAQRRQNAPSREGDDGLRDSFQLL